MYKREEILDFLRANKDLLLSKYSLTKIGIFGSYAREEQTEKSDIDIILEFEDNAKGMYSKEYALHEYLRKNNCCYSVLRKLALKKKYLEMP